MAVVQRAGRVYFAFYDKNEHHSGRGPMLTAGEEEKGRVVYDKLIVAESRREVQRMIESLTRFLTDFPEDE